MSAAETAVPGRRTAAALVSAGALLGLAWAAGLRGWMSQLAGIDSSVSWDTVTWILLPGTISGGLLGWAEYLRRTGGRRGWRWLALSPLMMAAFLVTPNGLRGLLAAGLGGGAPGVPLTSMAGGYAMSGRGLLWGRLASGLLGLAGVVGIGLTGTIVGPFTFRSPGGVWLTCYGASFVVAPMFACAIPFRAAGRPESPGGRHPAPHAGAAATSPHADVPG